MTDPSLAVQAAVEAALRTSDVVQESFAPDSVRVYVMAPPLDAPFPHILIGDDQVIGHDTECASSSEVAVNVHVYAREATPVQSRAKAKRIAGAVRMALTRQLTLEGHVCDDWIYDDTQHMTDPDRLTAHSVVRLTYWTTATA
ncbi:DUF3168 domain-containing protein [Brevundimonas sp. UBA5866]|uniref:DUF3168 domain-containing protein n=1 Tax=Brevundimonas sp. UBA5866 TaxID=1946132 RepID=UPI0025BFA33F|nr:DUF3168 domain-containing protein [Brevundimonas sp. UBA5866]